jgi:hypothetical protein
MNATGLMRFAWKEYRVLRGFWISLALMAALGQLFVVLSVSSTATVPALFAVALVATALYALGNGATMFATECEEETYELLRVLPVTERQVVLGKLAFCVASVLAIGAVLLVSAWVLAGGRVPAPESHRQLWATFGLGTLEVLAWGMFFSLLSSRPLQAAILGAFAASASASLLVYLDGHGRSIHMLPVYVNVVPERLLVLALVAAVDLGLARRWLHPVGDSRQGSEVPMARRLSRQRSEEAATTTRSIGAGLVRLTWQAWRQSRAVYACILLGTSVLAALSWGPESPQTHVLVMLAGTSLLGATIFLSDQEKLRFRFFAQQGVSARRVWLSRHLLGLTVTVVASLIAVVVMVATNDVDFFARFLYSQSYQYEQTSFEPGDWRLLVSGVLITVMVSAYTSGQLFSMLLRNGLLAGFFGLLLTVPLCAWVVLMARYRFSFFWSVLPILIALLLATWLRAPAWISQRNTWRGWLGVGLVATVPFLGVAATSAWQRVHEIPAVNVGFDVTAFLQPRTLEQRETAGMYREADALLRSYRPDEAGRPSPDRGGKIGQRELEWLEKNERALALARQASTRNSCPLSEPGIPIDRNLLFVRLERLGSLLVVAGREREQRGDLPGALDDYLAALHLSNCLRDKQGTSLHLLAMGIEGSVYVRLNVWSGRAQQTPDLLRRALSSLDERNAQRPPLSDAIKSDYAVARRVLSADIAAMQNAGLPEDVVQRIVLRSWLVPWELRRAGRLLDYVAFFELMAERFVQKSLQRGIPPHQADRSWYLYVDESNSQNQASDHSASTPRGHLLRQGPDRRTPFWLSTTPEMEAVFPWYVRHTLDHPLGRDLRDPYYALYRHETRRRAITVILALQLWRLQHGALPDALSELVGTTLQELPLDPFTGEPFRYFPDGVAQEGLQSSFSRDPLPPGTPFIWSARPGLELEREGAWEEEYTVGEKRWRLSSGPRLSDRAALEYAWKFPIRSLP